MRRIMFRKATIEGSILLYSHSKGNKGHFYLTLLNSWGFSFLFKNHLGRSRKLCKQRKWWERAKRECQMRISTCLSSFCSSLASHCLATYLIFSLMIWVCSSSSQSHSDLPSLKDSPYHLFLLGCHKSPPSILLSSRMRVLNSSKLKTYWLIFYTTTFLLLC